MAAANIAGGDRKVATAAAFLEAAAGRTCDGCHAAPAVLHCRADAAFICSPCDARVHGANGLASRHERAWLCEVCEHSPAVVTCKADAANLCASCDADIHSVNPLARRHERLPLLPFSGPSPKPPNENFLAPVAGTDYDKGEEDAEESESVVNTMACSWLLPSEDKPEARPATTDFFFSRGIDCFMDLACVPQMDSVVKKAVEPNGFFDLDLFGCKPEVVHSYCHSMSSSEAAVVPDISQQTAIKRPVADALATATRMDREAKVMKYREKRKNRRFEKTIRYASRKAYAEARPRIKGRFAKRVEVEEEAGMIYSSAVAALLEDDDFCVPLFYH